MANFRLHTGLQQGHGDGFTQAANLRVVFRNHHQPAFTTALFNDGLDIEWLDCRHVQDSCADLALDQFISDFQGTHGHQARGNDQHIITVS
ncbi:hypothetical protein D3C73_1404250 [compost metagenome]